MKIKKIIESKKILDSQTLNYPIYCHLDGRIYKLLTKDSEPIDITNEDTDAIN